MDVNGCFANLPFEHSMKSVIIQVFRDKSQILLISHLHTDLGLKFECCSHWIVGLVLASLSRLFSHKCQNDLLKKNLD